MLAYGFEDMTRAQVRALRALAARCPVTVSLPSASVSSTGVSVSVTPVAPGASVRR